MKRDLLVLFLPFRNEITEIHHSDVNIDQLYEMHKDGIERLRLQFEPNRQLLLNMEEAINNYHAENHENETDDNDERESDGNYIRERTP